VTGKDVLAVVVSYDGLQQTVRGVEALRGQVGHVYIVDNGSQAPSLALLEALEQDGYVTVARLGENLGVGHALNLGVRQARDKGFGWLLTMDQDSVVDRGLLAAYEAAIRADARQVCLAPTRIKQGEAPKNAAGREVRYAVTSGNLVAVGVFDEIGPYDEGFFIDCIDFDFCLRLRRAGHTIFRAAGALMQHTLGDGVDVPEPVRKFYARHPPIRRYYMYRNYLYLMERYLLAFPGFILKLGLLHVVLLPLMAFHDTQPVASYRAVGRGILDYLRRRTGPAMERSL